MLASLPLVEALKSPTRATDLVILAHGGSVEADNPARDWHSGLLRVLQFGDVAVKAAPGSAVGLLRYRVCGWNGASADPAQDVQRVIDAAPEQFERIVLIGHSMGGRAVLRASAHPRVGGVLALAPWVPADEPGLRPCDAPVVIATGTNDDTTPVGMARHFVRTSREGGSQLAYFEIPGAGHRLLLHADVVDRLIRSFLTHALGDGDDVMGASISGDPHRPPDSLPTLPGQRLRLSGPITNLCSVLAWKARGARQNLI
jgi:pimeloyl-ACP methyl ester carboxylesterase